MLILITEVIVELCEILVNEFEDFLSIILEIQGKSWRLHLGLCMLCQDLGDPRLCVEEDEQN